MSSAYICCIFHLSIHSGSLACAFEVVLIHSVRISFSRNLLSLYRISIRISFSHLLLRQLVFGVNRGWLELLWLQLCYLHVQDSWCPKLFRSILALICFILALTS